MSETPFFCEICQNQFGMGQQVELETGRKLPLCELCWNQVPIGDRLRFLAEVRRNMALEAAIDGLMAWLAEQRRDFNPFGTN